MRNEVNGIDTSKLQGGIGGNRFCRIGRAVINLAASRRIDRQGVSAKVRDKDGIADCQVSREDNARVQRRGGYDVDIVRNRQCGAVPWVVPAAVSPVVNVPAIDVA